MSGRRSRNKGSAYERNRAEFCRQVWPNARRGLGQARNAGEVCDVEESPYWIETKKHKRVSIQAAIEQAVKATDGRPVVVMSKDDRGRDLVTMLADDWIELARDSHDLRSVCVTAAHAAELDAADKALREAAERLEPVGISETNLKIGAAEE